MTTDRARRDFNNIKAQVSRTGLSHRVGPEFSYALEGASKVDFSAQTSSKNPLQVRSRGLAQLFAFLLFFIFYSTSHFLERIVITNNFENKLFFT